MSVAHSHRTLIRCTTNVSQVPGVPFTISTPTTSFVHVSSSTHVEELAEVPESTLSLNALAEDVGDVCIVSQQWKSNSC